MTYSLAIETLRVPGCFPSDMHFEAARFVLASGPVGRPLDVKLAKRALRGDFARKAARQAAKRAAQRGSR